MRALTSDSAEIELLSGKTPPSAVGEASAGYDLIVTVEPPMGSLLNRLRGRQPDQLTESAACSVLRVQSPHNETHVRFVWKNSEYAEGEIALVLEFIRPELAGARLDLKKKDALFEHFANQFADALPEIEAPQVLSALREREREQNTAVGNGVALPHRHEALPLPVVGKELPGGLSERNPVHARLDRDELREAAHTGLVGRIRERRVVGRGIMRIQCAR